MSMSTSSMTSSNLSSTEIADTMDQLESLLADVQDVHSTSTVWDQLATVDTTQESEDFPSLAKASKTAPKKKDKMSKTKFDKKNAKKFIVTSTQVEQKTTPKPRTTKEYNQGTMNKPLGDDDKKQTWPCKNVFKQEDGSYSVCTRPNCWFAHSVADLKVKPCRFGRDCNRIDGKLYNNGDFDPANKCTFNHHETQEQYSKRLNLSDLLPPTSEHSYKPIFREPRPPRYDVYPPPPRPAMHHSHHSQPQLPMQITQTHAPIPELAPRRPQSQEVPQMMRSSPQLQPQQPTGMQIIRIPVAQFEKALEMAMIKGWTNVHFETY